MTTMIEDRAGLDALDNGTEMRDADGYYVMKNRDGDYVVTHPTNGDSMTMSACEINGDYTGASRFYPLAIIGHCWYCDRETTRPMYGETGQDWSCTEIHDDPR